MTHEQLWQSYLQALAERNDERYLRQAVEAKVIALELALQRERRLRVQAGQLAAHLLGRGPS